MIRSPINRMARIDLSRAPSSMEQMAAGWSRAPVQSPRRVPMTLREVLALEDARAEARRAELERGR